jgi:hypothetical protein
VCSFGLLIEERTRRRKGRGREGKGREGKRRLLVFCFGVF